MLVMFCQTVSMLVFNMTVHNMHATVLACTHSHKLTVHALCSVLGLGHPHLVTKVNTLARSALNNLQARLTRPNQ